MRTASALYCLSCPLFQKLAVSNAYRLNVLTTPSARNCCQCHTSCLLLLLLLLRLLLLLVLPPLLLLLLPLLSFSYGDRLAAFRGPLRADGRAE